MLLDTQRTEKVTKAFKRKVKYYNLVYKMTGRQQTKLRPCIGRFCKVFFILILVGGCSLLSASVKKIPDGFLSIKRGSNDVKQGMFMELPWEGANRYNIPTQGEVMIPTITRLNGPLSKLRSLKISRNCKVKYKIKDAKAFAHHLMVKNMDVADFNKALIVVNTRAAERDKLKSFQKLYFFLNITKMVCTAEPTVFKFRSRPNCVKGNYHLTDLTSNGTRVVTKNKYVHVV